MVNLGGLTAYLRADMKDFSVKLKRATKNLKTFTIKTERLLRKSSAAFKALGRAATRLGNTIKRQVKRMSIVVVAALGASIKAYANFDDAMTKSLAIMSGITPKIRKQMEEMAKTISLKSVTSATDLGKAYFYLASAGLDAQQSIKALAAMERFAVAGAFDMATATDLATDAQSALGLTMTDAIKNKESLIHVTDVLVGANTLANATVEQFSAALTSDAGPAMKAYKIELEEGVAVLAAYADQGIKAQHAGNMFSRMLRLMIKGFADNEDAWKTFGASIYDAQGELKPMYEIIREITKGLEGMSTKQKAAQFEMLGFQARSQQVILPLIGLADRIEEYNQKLLKMKGITRDIYEKQLTSFSAQMKILWNNIVDVSLAVGERLVPSIQKIGLWMRKNQRIIEDWAVAFADRIVFVKDVISNFVLFMKKDWAAGTGLALKILLELFAGFGKSIVVILKNAAIEASDAFIQAFGERLGKWLIEASGLTEGITGKLSLLLKYPLTGAMRLKALEAGTALMEKAAKPSTPTNIKRDLKEVADATVSNIRRISEVAKKASGIDILIGPLDELRLKDSQRQMETWWRNVKEAAQPTIDAVTNLKEQMLGLFSFGKKVTEPKPKPKTITMLDKEKSEEEALEIEVAYRNMFGEMGRMTAENYQYQLGILEKLKENYLQLGMDKLVVEQWFSEQVRLLEIERLKATDNMVDGIKAAGKVIKDEVQTWGEVAFDVTMSMKTNFGNAMFDMIENGKKFKDAMVGFLKDIERAMMQAITQKIAGNILAAAIPSMFGVSTQPTVTRSLPPGSVYVSPITGEIAHAGGVIGAGMLQKKFPSSIFNNAPRLHAGLQADEFPAILQRGETVIPKEQAGNAVNVEINVINQTSKPVDAQIGEQKFDGKKFVTQVILKDISQGGILRNAIRSVR